MMLVKCPQCSRSYRLAESLYRRKAAGFGVVITCRNCKTQIHVDENGNAVIADAASAAAHEMVHEEPPVDEIANALDALTMDKSSPDASPNDPPSSPEQSGPEAAAMPLVAKPAVSAEKRAVAVTPKTAPVVEKQDAPSPVLPKVAPKPTAAAPRPGGIPRPGAASPPRPGMSATGTPLPGGVMGTPLPLGVTGGPPLVKTPSELTTLSTSLTAPKAKLVALSPGLLGVKTAEKPLVAKPAARPEPPPPPPEEPPPDSSAPMSLPDSELFTIDEEPPTQGPDSTMPLESVDYVESLRAPMPPPLRVPHVSEGDEDDDDEKTIARGGVVYEPKKLPHAPPVRRLPPGATSGEPRTDELPSDTGTPKMAELAHGSSPLPLSQKKGEPKRARQPSGDLTDDLLSSDLSFDSPMPLAPPNADALMRAPVSTRPGAVTSVKPANGSTKAPVSASAPAAEKKGGRGFALLLIAAAFGSAGFFLRHRLPHGTPVAEPAPEAPAVNAPPAPEPAPPPVAEAPSAVAEASAAPPEAPAPAPAPADTTGTTPGATTGTTPGATTGTTPGATTGTKPTTGTTPTAVATPTAAKPPRPEPTAAPAPTAEKQAATPTPKPTAAPTSLEPRGSAGTDPFDVAAARAALDGTAAQASTCRKEGDPSGVAVVTITFSQTGRVTTANISGPPFQATATGGCIASTMRRTRVPAFAGEMVTVRKTITVQ